MPTTSNFAPICLTRCCNHAKVSQVSVNGSYTLDTCKNAHLIDVKFANHLAMLFLGKRVLELGAGCGCYTHRLINSGADVTAFDGTANIAELTQGLVNPQDVTVPFLPGEQFDYVLSLEVAEHIPPHLEGAFLDALTSHAREGIVLSWAVPGQRGDFHVNCRSNEHVAKQLSRRGWELNANATAVLRKKVGMFWFSNTAMIFARGVGGTNDHRTLRGLRSTSSHKHNQLGSTERPSRHAALAT